VDERSRGTHRFGRGVMDCTDQAPEYDGDRFVPVLRIAHDGQTAGLGGPTLDSPGSAPVA